MRANRFGVRAAGAYCCSGATPDLPASNHGKQVTIAGGVGHPNIKKLVYDLCRAVPLVDADYSLLLDGIKVGCTRLVDLVEAGSWLVAAAAQCTLAHALPACHNPLTE